MHQVWACYNLDKHERCWDGDLYSLFFSDDEMGPLLTRPAQTSSMIRHIEEEVLPGLFGESMKTGQLTTSNKSPILKKIPNEIFYIICGHIDGLDNIVCFALTCPLFWGVAKPHIMRVRDAIVTERLWAGDRIICARENSDDWPSSIPEKERESYLSKTEWPFRLANDVSLLESENDRWLNKLERDAYRCICLLENDHDGYNFVLRNISKKVYVNESELRELVGGFDFLTHQLAHIALSKICWSSDPSSDIYYQGPIHRGEWAGDRLEIVSLDWHTQEIEDATKKIQQDVPGSVDAEQSSPSSSSTNISGSRAEWKDVTDECVKLIEDIWKAQKGRKWLRELLRGYYWDYYSFDISEVDPDSDSEQDLTDGSI